MKVPLIWLKDLTNIDVSAEELASKMTMTGTRVRRIIRCGNGISKVYTGRIISIKDHPDSDHLKILSVDLGSDELGHDLQIVCGAPNVYEGMICPVATEGAVLPDQHIKKGKLRGVDSYGMCCSAEELGIEEESLQEAGGLGLWDLPSDTPVGADIMELLGKRGIILDYEITSGRPDCLSVEGIAREAALTLGNEFRPSAPSLKEEGSCASSDAADDVITDLRLCSGYLFRTVENVNVKRSSGEILERLQQSGVTPVNNFIDIASYVTLELGIPVFAYDIDELKGRTIYVRSANEGETVALPDGRVLQLDPSYTVTSDAEDIMSLSGVVEDKKFQVKEDTSKVLFECALYSRDKVAANAGKSGLHTQSSLRYEAGVDKEGAKRALERVCELVERYRLGKVDKGFGGFEAERDALIKIPFDPVKIDSFLGTDIGEGYMRKTLVGSGCVFEDMNVIPPSYRSDLKTQADLAGEIVRFYGFDNIKPTLSSSGKVTVGGRNAKQKIEKKIKDTMVSSGFYEAVTYPFEDPSDMDLLLIPSDSPLKDDLKISGPKGCDDISLRTSMLPSMIRIASRNFTAGNHDAKIFETGNVYIRADGDEGPCEEHKMLAGFYYSSLASVKAEDVFYETKGALEELAAVLGIKQVLFEAFDQHPSFHPGRCAQMIVNGISAGFVGMLLPEVTEKFACPPASCFFEIKEELLIDSSVTERFYEPLPRYPGVAREVSLELPMKSAVGDVIKAFRSYGGKYLREVEFLDVLEEGKEDRKTVSVSLYFRADERTLSDADIAPSYEKMIEKMIKQFDGKVI